MEYVLETNAITKRYRGFTALSGLTMRIPKGSIYGFVGRNGAGKTTLIRVICGLQEPTDGSYTLWSVKNTDAAILRCRRRMGAVVETPAIYPEMTARDNIRQQYRVLGLPSDDGIDALLHLVGLGDTGRKKAGDFSLGMRQRLGIAVALAGDPDFLVLDEPAAGLDPRGREEILGGIRSYQRRRGSSVVIVSHSMEDMARYSDEIIVMDHAKVKMQGTTREIFERADELVSVGLDVPQITEVMNLLRSRGLPVRNGIYTVDDARDEILRLLGRKVPGGEK